MTYSGHQIKMSMYFDLLQRQQTISFSEEEMTAVIKLATMKVIIALSIVIAIEPL